MISKEGKLKVRQVFSGEEISLADVFKLFYSRGIYIVVGGVIFFVVGYVIAKTTPKEYEASVTVLSEGTGSVSIGGLTDLIGLAGIRNSRPRGAGASDFGDNMYPKILSSTPFLLELMNERFYFKERKKELSLFEYFQYDEEEHFFKEAQLFFKEFPSEIQILVGLKKRRKKKIVEHETKVIEGYPQISDLSSQERRAISKLKGRISIQSTEGLIVLTTKMQDPLVSAQLTTVVLDKLIKYITEKQTEKQRLDLMFIRERKTEAEEKYINAQRRLAAFRDENEGNLSERVRAIEQQLTAEFNLAFSMFNTLAQQLEQAEIQIKKETPLFSVFEPVVLPNVSSEPKATVIVSLYTAIGVFLGLILIFLSLALRYFVEGKTFEAKFWKFNRTYRF